MKDKYLLIMLLLMIGISGEAFSQNTPDEDAPPMLCVENYWTQEEGKAFLEKMEQSYTSASQWEKRAQQIRAQLLRGAGLEKFPEKTPLHPILGEVRQYEGYTLQNFAFESLPGVYVTGSLYQPIGKTGKIPGIISPHGHGTTPGK